MHCSFFRMSSFFALDALYMVKNVSKNEIVLKKICLDLLAGIS